MFRLVEIRKIKKITQKELAKALSVHQTAVSQWETGRTDPDCTSLKSIAQFLSVSTDYLLELTEDPSPKSIHYSPIETAHIKKYRALDDHGKEITDMVMALEYNRQLVHR